MRLPASYHRQAQRLEATDAVIRVWLVDGRTLTVPMHWFPRLCNGTPVERNNWELTEGDTLIRWPDLGVELTVESLLTNSPPDADADGARVEDMNVSGHTISVWLTDGRTLTVPLHWFPRLCNGTSEERNNWEAWDGRSRMYWPDLDEILTVEGMLAGAWSAEQARSLGKWLLARGEGRGVAGYEIFEHHRSEQKPVPLA